MHRLTVNKDDSVHLYDDRRQRFYHSPKISFRPGEVRKSRDHRHYAYDFFSIAMQKMNNLTLLRKQ